VTLLDVAPGTYRLRVVFGDSWTGRAFARGATFVQREEPAKVVPRSYAADERPPVIVLDGRSGLQQTAAFQLE